jgi:hypothetical protein
MIHEIVLSELSLEDGVDFKDCLFHEYLLMEDLKYRNLKKWIRYAAVEYGDADQVLKTSNNSQLLCEKLEWDDCRYIDCIFSFKTFFNAFLRLYFKGDMPYYGELMDDFDEFFCDSNMEEFRKEHGLSKNELENFLVQINIFAMQTHTIGNYMPCPDNLYNGIKGSGDGYVYFQDRIELLWDSIDLGKHEDYIGKETSERWKEWFGCNTEKYCLNEIKKRRSELLRFKCPSMKKGRFTIFVMKNKNNIIDYTHYLAVVNSIIRNRTERMIGKLVAKDR